MKTLAVYYSKTGNTQKVANALASGGACDLDELQYDEATKAIRHALDPSDYERVVILAPVWAFGLANPMKQYIAKHKSAIKQYDLIVTCGLWGLRGCVKHCLSSIGSPPGKAMKIKAKDAKAGTFDVSGIL